MKPGNREARKLVLEAASHEDEIFDEPITEIDPRFNLTGAQLSKMTQMLAYQGICETKKLRYKQGMACMLDITRYAVEGPSDLSHQTRRYGDRYKIRISQGHAEPSCGRPSTMPIK